MLKEAVADGLDLKIGERNALTQLPGDGVSQYNFEELSETPPDADVPWLDRSTVDAQSLTALQASWRRDGMYRASGLIPEADLDAYAAWRARRRLPDALGALPISYGYMFVDEIRKITCARPIYDLMVEIFQEPLVAHFDLTQWRSTERAWHQDDYLNDESVNGHYAAVWFAIDDIDMDSGPFQYVPGSNNWPVVRRRHIKERLPAEVAKSNQWPQASQGWLGDVYEHEIEKRGVAPVSFDAKKGEVLLWHARLVHRGSKPKNPTLARRSLICHYTAQSKTIPNYHDIRYTEDGVPYIYHKNMAFRDWGEGTGVIP